MTLASLDRWLESEGAELWRARRLSGRVYVELRLAWTLGRHLGPSAKGSGATLAEALDAALMRWPSVKAEALARRGASS